MRRLVPISIAIALLAIAAGVVLQHPDRIPRRAEQALRQIPFRDGQAAVYLSGSQLTVQVLQKYLGGLLTFATEETLHVERDPDTVLSAVAVRTRAAFALGGVVWDSRVIRVEAVDGTMRQQITLGPEKSFLFVWPGGVQQVPAVRAFDRSGVVLFQTNP